MCSTVWVTWAHVYRLVVPTLNSEKCMQEVVYFYLGYTFSGSDIDRCIWSQWTGLNLKQDCAYLYHSFKFFCWLVTAHRNICKCNPSIAHPISRYSVYSDSSPSQVPETVNIKPASPLFSTTKCHDISFPQHKCVMHPFAQQDQLKGVSSGF